MRMQAPRRDINVAGNRVTGGGDRVPGCHHVVSVRERVANSEISWRRMVCESVKKSTPYSCRDTFITEQLSKGVSSTIIAKWCDTSVKMIETHYFDSSVINILPL